MTDQELRAFARLVMSALAHRMGCPFAGCTCGAAAQAPAAYAQASKIVREVPVIGLIGCQYCGEGEYCGDPEPDHVGVCCDCWEMYVLALGLEPFECSPTSLARVQEKVRRTKERTGLDLP